MQVQDTDPLMPQQDSTSSVPQGYSGGDLTSGWNDWINKPNNRAALAQFGIAMLQPMGMGEGTLSHFANAAGAAGEASQNVTKEAQQQEKLDTDTTARLTTANAAETRANAAQDRALYSGQLQNERGLTSQLQAQARARAEYDTYLKNITKSNNDVDLVGVGQKQPILTFEDWLSSARGGGAAAGAGTPVVEEDKTQKVLRNPDIQSQRQAVLDAARSNDPTQRAKAKQYVDTRIAPYIKPEDLPKVYQMYGIH